MESSEEISVREVREVFILSRTEERRSPRTMEWVLGGRRGLYSLDVLIRDDLMDWIASVQV